MLVGPTGVGKTTTVAKLAARYAERSWSVEVITNDMYRVAAVDQLAQYAELIGVPLRTAGTPGEVKRLLDNSTADLVLIDTAGRSHLDGERMNRLYKLVEVTRPDYVFLCLSLTGSYRDTVDVIKQYAGVEFNRLLFTKLDETRQAGLVLNLADQTSVPLSYISTGQRVPQDLIRANAHQLAELLMEVNAP
jgi:flagellar biosynthesis protein FlhF